MKRVLGNASALAERNRVSIEHDVPVDLPHVMADVTAISQCLQNLVVNAVKYSGESRWVRVRARVERTGGRHEVQISVQDKGIGISSTDLPHIFEPFYRSAEVQAAQIHGTGLGLTLAHRMAEAMGGKLSVTSKPGVGSTFTLHLVPATKNSVPSDEAVAASSTQTEG